MTPTEAAPRRLHLVRHGESQWNVRGVLQGQTMSVGLTAAGVAQAREAAERLTRFPVGRVLSSDQLRAWETAQVIGSRLGVDPEPEPALREQSLGYWEGRPAEELGTSSPGRLDPERRWGGGESVRGVHERVGALLLAVVDEDDQRDAVLVTHGDTLRVAVAWLRGLGPEQVDWSPVPNGQVVTVAAKVSGCPSRSVDRR